MSDEYEIFAAAVFILSSKDGLPHKRHTYVRLSLNKKKYKSNCVLIDYIKNDLIGFRPGKRIRSTLNIIKIFSYVKYRF